MVQDPFFTTEDTEGPEKTTIGQRHFTNNLCTTLMWERKVALL